MSWELGLVIGGVLLVFFVLMFFIIKESDAEQKRQEENTIRLMTGEQVREFLAEKLEVKPSQVKFRIEDGRFVGIRVMKYIEE
jgi:hypothetical protein